MKRKEKSQRTLGGKRRKSSISPTPSRSKDTDFISLMSKVGFKFDENGNKMITNSTVVQQKLLEHLNKNSDAKIDLKKSISSSMSDSFENEQFFVHCLLPTELVTVEDGLDMDSSQFSNNIQDSLVKVLLRCEPLQSIVIEALLQKFPNYTDNENVQVKSLMHQGSVQSIVNIPRLILNQLRWVNVIHNAVSIAEHLIEMASLMQSAAACDMICFLPDLLVSDNDHSEIATSLCNLLNSGPENITTAVFDALANLVISDSVAKDIQEIALANLTTAELKDIPIIVKYLLKSTLNIQSTKEVISSLRPNIDFSVLTQSSSEEDAASSKSNITLIADVLFSAIKFHSNVFSAWISVLEKIDKPQFNVGDLVSLFLLCDVQNTTHKKNALTLLHNKLKSGQISDKVFTSTFTTCSYILEAHFKSISKTTQGLVWNSNPQLKETGSLMYKLSLLHLEPYYKQETLGFIIEHISATNASSGNTSEADTALDVLREVAQVEVGILLPYASYISDSLTNMDIMNLSQVRKSYRILCYMAFTDSTDAYILGMKDELQMMLRKQLTNLSERYQHVGIIGCLTSLIAMSQSNKKKDSSPATDIQSLFKTLNYLLGNQAHSWSLFYDEICIACKSYGKLPGQLIKLLNKHAQEKLQLLFVTDCDQPASTSSHSLETGCRFGLSSDDKDSDVAVNLIPNAARINDQSVMLCSLFQAIASLEKMSKGSLDNIDALQCCPLVMFSSKYEEKTVFRSLNNEQATQVLDCLFASINWIREVLGIFSMECDDDAENNILPRLKNACEIQSILEYLLPTAPTYTPPCSNNNSVVHSAPKMNQTISSKSQTSSSTQKLQKTLNQTDLPTPSAAIKSPKAAKKKTAVVPPTSKVSLFSSKYIPYLRELNKEVFFLLKHPLLCNQSEAEKSVSEQDHLEPQHLLFLLTDLNFKLHHRLGGFKAPRNGLERLSECPVHEVAKYAVKLVPHLCIHLEKISNHFKKRNISNASQSSNTSLSSTHSGENLKQFEQLSKCYECLLEILVEIFDYRDIDEGSGETLLDGILNHITNKCKPKHKKPDPVVKTFIYTKQFVDTVPTFNAACTLLKLSSSILGFAPDKDVAETKCKDMAVSLSDCAVGFLQQEWSDLQSAAGSQSNHKLLATMFNLHLEPSPDVLESIETFLQNSLTQLLGGMPPDSEEAEPIEYKCINKSNYFVFYKGMMEALATFSSRILPPSNKNNSDSENSKLLINWSEVVKVLDLLIRVLKSFPMRVMLAPALKHARIIVERFIKTGIPLCEAMFRTHQDEIIALLKRIQQVTRQLQNAACHAKLSKDTMLTNHVPALRRCLESFIFRVKGIFVLHNCHEAFWLGNLKNKNLKGEVILTQAAPSDSDDDDASDVTVTHPLRDEESYSESY
uniref:Fanconi anemia group D2 protein n=1 Tax=Ciona intestinalis TaxID=7719 RepID=UPI000180B658|nr:Fanconi anemia group D2 protein [Ciona intestinalis]|eukprot:XP_002130241.1 Fanconi anemia group D2 protein [Ciona intestinalis]